MRVNVHRQAACFGLKLCPSTGRAQLEHVSCFSDCDRQVLCA